MTLFSPSTLRSVTLRNRLAVSPMCQYTAEDGFANDWHLVHLGSRAVGSAGLVLTEAAAFSDTCPEPQALDEEGTGAVIRAFVDAAKRALDSGFKVVELHAAHGYLLHSSLSPLSNTRSDRYGGPFEQADTLLRTEQADLVFLARALLRDPYWPLHAAAELKTGALWPPQYERAVS